MASFVVSYILLFQKKKIQNAQEKANLKARFEQETLNAKNEVQEATMQHISRELHDNVGQLLSLVKIQLNAVENEYPNSKRVADSKTYLDQALTDIRELSKTLNSENILTAGLAAGVKFELQRIEKTGFLKTHVTEQAPNFQLHPKVEIIVFRMFQEAVQNIIKHAKAKNVWVSLHKIGNSCIFQILDDGVGFDTSQMHEQQGFRAGAGLANLQSRAALIQGKLQIESSPSQGTKLILELPYETRLHDNRSPD